VHPDTAIALRKARAFPPAPQGGIAVAFDAVPALHLVLASSTAEGAAALWDRYPTRVLIAETDGLEPLGDGRLIEEATENLRYLTERTALMRLR
jgi:hypothetical protein